MPNLHTVAQCYESTLTIMNLTRPPPIPLPALKLLSSPSLSATTVTASRDNSDVAAATAFNVVVMTDQLIDRQG